MNTDNINILCSNVTMINMSIVFSINRFKCLLQPSNVWLITIMINVKLIMVN